MDAKAFEVTVYINLADKSASEADREELAAFLDLQARLWMHARGMMCEHVLCNATVSVVDYK